MKRQVNRRELLQGGAGLAAGMALAGCGVGNVDRGTKAETEKPIKKKVDGDLVYFNYSEYIDPELVKGFEKQYGVKVRESYFDSMSAMTAKMRAGIAFDVIFPSSEYVQRLLTGNLLRRIDRDKLKNIDTVYPEFADPWYDKGSEHSTPYGMYATGLGFRADKVEMTGSWRDLGTVDTDDRSFLLDDYQESIGMANLVNGYELNETDPDKLEKSQGVPRGPQAQAARHLRGHDHEHDQRAGVDPAPLERRHRQHPQHGRQPRGLQVPEVQEGIPVGNDNFVIPVNAEHPGTALLFIEWMLEPEHAAQNVEWIGYPMPYEGAPSEAFQGLVKDDPEINVTPEDLENGQQFENLKGDGRLEWDKVWTEFRIS